MRTRSVFILLCYLVAICFSVLPYFLKLVFTRDYSSSYRINQIYSFSSSFSLGRYHLSGSRLGRAELSRVLVVSNAAHVVVGIRPIRGRGGLLVLFRRSFVEDGQQLVGVCRKVLQVNDRVRA